MYSCRKKSLKTSMG